MNRYTLCLFALSASFVAAQSVPNSSQADRDVTIPAWPQTGSGASAYNNNLQSPEQRLYVDPFANGANVSSQTNSGLDRFPTSVTKPITTKSEFEIFAEDAAGRPIPVFGRQLFDQAPTTFAPMDRVPVPTNYVLGAGDELLVRVWGKVELQARVTVDRNGQIFIPKVGTVTVAGLRYDQLESGIRSAIANLYKDFELNVTMGQLRSIQIFVLGSARQPGVYTVSSLSTLVTALFASGGPSATGSMRHIQLRRANQIVTEFDVYDMLRNGDKSHDAQLLPGDVIYIPPVGPQTAVIGSVTEAGIYELQDSSTVASILKDAAGLTNLAGADRALLERVQDHRRRQIDEFALDAAGLQRSLKDGDILRIFPISPKFENVVTLRGNVAQPGHYIWKPGMRISDLIPTRDFLITRDFWNRQNELVPARMNHGFGTQRFDEFDMRRSDQSMGQRPDQSMNRRSDQVMNQRTGASMDQRSSQVMDQRTGQSTEQRSGQIMNQQTSQSGPADQTGPSRTSMIESVGQNSAEINWEYAVIERLDDQDLSTRLIPFRLASAINDSASADNQLLRAGDVVTIFSRSDLELPVEKHSSFIRVGGEVNAPGLYRVNPGETLRDVVARAGGLTSHSYLYASVLTRVSTRHVQEEQLHQSTEQMQRELISRYANATPQAGQTGADQQAQLAIQQASLARLSSIRPTGRVVLEMKPDSATAADIPDFPLEDGDTFYVPPRLSTIQVAGAVYNANAFRHQPEKPLVAYLNDAGGATRQADQKRIFVIRADGTVVSRQSRNGHFRGGFDQLRLLPGDAIVVPEKLRVSSKMNEILQATQFASQTALTAAALSVIH